MILLTITLTMCDSCADAAMKSGITIVLQSLSLYFVFFFNELQATSKYKIFKDVIESDHKFFVFLIEDAF
jgi:hypothetical protein